jgi:hypothetical protein
VDHSTILIFLPVKEDAPDHDGQELLIPLLPVNLTFQDTICMQSVFIPAVPLKVRSARGKYSAPSIFDVLLPLI